ncbi:MAG: HAD family phosphatase [Bacilli bacterium]|nr:HAD family phosphatase [Bacilli bacterium]
MIFVASDFDNTLYLLDDDEQNMKNVKAILKFKFSGNCFCIITGRNFTDVKKLLNEYSVPYDYLICEDGAKIFDKDDFCLETTYLDFKMVQKIVDLLRNRPCSYYLDNGYDKTENIYQCVKVVVECSDEKEKKEIVSYIKSALDVHIYASRYHVNIIDSSVNKRVALEKLFQIKNIEESTVSVIGDNDNDYEMIEHFQGSIMRKHHPILDSLHRREFDTLEEYLEELMNN